GLSLIAVSVAGTVAVITLNREGTVIIVASHFITAGTVLTDDDIEHATIRVGADIPIDAETHVLGRRVATDIAPGESITSHDIDSTVARRRVISVPLTIAPPSYLRPGDRIQLWFAPTRQGDVPVVVTSDAVVVALRAGGFGEGAIVDVSIVDRDEAKTIAALGSDGAILAVIGDAMS
ncbi:MAG: hypothetical protein RLZZ40_1135, partial [Actinomycetota bacterium]